MFCHCSGAAVGTAAEVRGRGGGGAELGRPAEAQAARSVRTERVASLLIISFVDESDLRRERTPIRIRTRQLLLQPVFRHSGRVDW
jgi:hypothetical protein